MYVEHSIVSSDIFSKYIGTIMLHVLSSTRMWDGRVDVSRWMWDEELVPALLNRNCPDFGFTERTDKHESGMHCVCLCTSGEVHSEDKESVL